jgi:hypothetical protein
LGETKLSDIETPSADAILAALKTNEGLAAILKLRVQEEFYSFLKFFATGVLGFGALTFYYLAYDLPTKAAEDAKKVLEANLQQKLQDLRNLENEISTVSGKARNTISQVSDTETQLIARANAAQTQAQNLNKDLNGLGDQQSALNQRAVTLKAQFDAVEKQIALLKSDKVQETLADIDGVKGNALRQLMKGLPPDALVLTAGGCPAGWKEEESAQGALFVGAGTRRNAVPHTLVLQSSDIPSVRVAGSTTAGTATFGVPTALRVGDASGNGALSLASCKDKKCVPTPASTVQVNVSAPALPLQGAAGSANPTPVRRLYPVHVCRLA